MASPRHQHGSLKQTPSAFYAPLFPRPLQPERSDVQLTALDRFEDQWRSSQRRVVPIENANSPLRLDYQRAHSTAPPSPNAPFYVPRQYEPPVYQQQDRQDGDGRVPREQIYVQVNQAPRHPAIHPSTPAYQPWQRIPDFDRSSDHSRPQFNAYQPSHIAPRPATVPPHQYRQQPHPRHSRPDSRSRRHPYAESRRRRRSTSSQPKHPQRRRFTPPQHLQRQLPDRPSLR